MVALISPVYTCLLAATLIAAKLPNELSSLSFGRFKVSWDAKEPFLLIRHEAEPDKILFQTLQSWPFITIGYATDFRPPIVDGNFKVNEWTLFETPYQNIKTVQMENPNELVIVGEVWGLVTLAEYVMRLYIPVDESGVLLDQQIAFTINVTPLQETFNRVFLNYWCDPKENFYGFGTQYSHWNMKGRRIPILVSEQGIGRGAEPLTTLLNVMADKAGGDWSTSYAPKPLYITNFNRSLLIENSEITFFDTRDDDSVVIEVWGSTLRGRILYGTSPLDLITQITVYTGRMAPLPEWSQRGAIVGLEGGTAEILSVTKKLLHNPVPVPIAAVWVQDWVGLRNAFDGDRLDWNWVLDKDYYPDWRGLVATLSCRGIRMLSYVNPFFSNSNDPYGGSTHVRYRPVHDPGDAQVSGRGPSLSTECTERTVEQPPVVSDVQTGAGATPAPRNLYQEGLQHQYFVQSPVPGVGAYKFHSGSIEFCMLDLTNPAARTWMKAILKEQMLRDTGVSGWMADFGEYLPFDAVLYDGSSGAVQHNKYPEQWAQLNYEAVQEYEAELAVLKPPSESAAAPPTPPPTQQRSVRIDHAPSKGRFGLRGVPGISQLLSFLDLRLPFRARREPVPTEEPDPETTQTQPAANTAPPSVPSAEETMPLVAETASPSRREVLYFMRSAWLQSPKYVSAFWLGDQMVSWDRHDGIKTVLLGTLSSGISGHSLTHSDIGGYTMQDAGGPLQYVRSRELLMRWSELEAFGSALYRSHIGLSTSPLNAQIYDDCTSITHFALFASIFAQLAPYREKLMSEAQQRGWPLIRPMAAHYGHDDVCWEQTTQYMFGGDFLVAPVLDPAVVRGSGNSAIFAKRAHNKKDPSNSTPDAPLKPPGVLNSSSAEAATCADFTCWGSVTVKVYLPAHSDWVHLWSGALVSGGADGRYVSVEAPVAAPPVFYRPDSEHGRALREYIVHRGMGVRTKSQQRAGSTEAVQTAGTDIEGALVIADIVEYVDRDWYDWLGIKQYASTLPT